MDPLEQDLKHEFQLERIIFFSDAVFAIAITLLIIDIRIPFREGFSDKLLLQALGDKIPELIGFLISFFFIGGYWIVHHKMFGYVRRFDTRLIWLNLFFLLSVVLLPFTTGVWGMYSNLIVAYGLYTLNVIFTGIMNFFCWRHITNPKNRLSTGFESPATRRAAYARSLAVPACFLVCFFIGWATWPPAGAMCLCVIPIVMKFVTRKFSTQPSPSSTHQKNPDI